MGRLYKIFELYLHVLINNFVMMKSLILWQIILNAHLE